MTAARILIAARARVVRRGWRQGFYYQGRRGPICMGEALVVPGLTGTVARHARDCVVESVGSDSIIVWNGAPGRTLAEGLDAFDQAILLAEGAA